MSQPIRITLPYPPSANRYWRTATVCGRSQTYLSAEAKQYRADVQKLAMLAGIRQPFDGRIQLHVELYPKRPQDWARRAAKNPETWDDDVLCIDLGNCEKVLSDALNGVAWVDDKKHRRIILDRMEPDGEARLVVTITPMAGNRTPQASLLDAA